MSLWSELVRHQHEAKTLNLEVSLPCLSLCLWRTMSRTHLVSSHPSAPPFKVERGDTCRWLTAVESQVCRHKAAFTVGVPWACRLRQWTNTWLEWHIAGLFFPPVHPSPSVSFHSWWWEGLMLPSAGQQILSYRITLLLFIKETGGMAVWPLACFPLPSWIHTAFACLPFVSPVFPFFLIFCLFSSVETNCRNEVRLCVCACLWVCV